MTPQAGVDWIQEMMWIAIVAGGPVILTVAAVGLVLAVVQAATQVNDAAVPFVAKALSVFAAVAISGAWMLQQVIDFCGQIFEAMANITH
ncbi:MAG: flagellar biosynthetic protein FliQ [Sandaracinaceae bacterium]